MLLQLFASLSNKHVGRVAIIFHNGPVPFARFHGALEAFKTVKLKTVDNIRDRVTMTRVKGPFQCVKCLL